MAPIADQAPMSQANDQLAPSVLRTAQSTEESDGRREEVALASKARLLRFVGATTEFSLLDGSITPRRSCSMVREGEDGDMEGAVLSPSVTPAAPLPTFFDATTAEVLRKQELAVLAAEASRLQAESEEALATPQPNESCQIVRHYHDPSAAFDDQLQDDEIGRARPSCDVRSYLCQHLQSGGVGFASPPRHNREGNVDNARGDETEG